jgi:hypothetical protein
MYSETKEILETIRTKADVWRILTEVEALEQGLFRSGENSYEDVMRKLVRSEIAGILTSQNRSEVDKKGVLREINECVKKLRLLKITLAIDPPPLIIDKIAQWIHQNVGAEIVLDIEVDPGILSGARVSFEGRYGDFTLIKEWERVWKEKSEEMMKGVIYG